MKADPHWVRDSLVEDAVAPVAAAGKIPDRQGVEAYIVDVLSKLEQKPAQAPASEPGQVLPQPEVEAKEAARRAGREVQGSIDRSLRIEKKPIDAPIKFVLRARTRLAMLRRNPEIRRQIESLVPGLLSGKPHLREKAADKLRKILDDSTKLAGYHWLAEKPRVIYG